MEFFVPGIPATAGSKKPFLYKGKKDGKYHASMAPDNKRQKPWMATVRFFAIEQMGTPVKGPVLLTLWFTLPRPKSHYGTGKNSDRLKGSAPEYPIVKPDLTKMARAVEDALKGVCWIDDNQVVKQRNEKRYGDRPGVYVMISEIQGEGI